MRAGGSDFVEKPFSINELIEKIERCLGINNCATESTAVELIVQEASKFGLVGQSPLFLELLQQVAIAGKLTLPVMIYGPIGVGKRTFVQFIHHLRTMNGVVRDEEVHIIDCCALPSLEEFTAMLSCATTVFLYHVDRLPYEYQHVLVRECAHKRMLLYATATQSLYRAVTAGSILAALYDLVHCMPLEIPALSQRPYDIPLLVGHYLNKKNLENNRLVQIDQAAVRALRNHEWKKNIAELELVLQQCSAHAELYGGVITIEMVQRYLSRVDSTLIEEQLYHEYTSFDEAVACFQKKFLLYHLKKNRYDLELVSHKTKLNIVQLQNKLAALNIVFKK
jgi:DNA-binding NtrC family response regulator